MPFPPTVALLLLLAAGSLAGAQFEPLLVLPDGWQVAESRERVLLARHQPTGVELAVVFVLADDPLDEFRELRNRTGGTAWANRRSANDLRGLGSLQRMDQPALDPWSGCLVRSHLQGTALALRSGKQVFRAMESNLQISFRHGSLDLVALVEGDLGPAGKALQAACASLRPHPRNQSLGRNPAVAERDADRLAAVRQSRPQLDPLPLVYQPGTELRILPAGIPAAYQGGLYDPRFQAVRDRYDGLSHTWLGGPGGAQRNETRRVIGVFAAGAPADAPALRLILSYRRAADGSGRSDEMLTLLPDDGVLRHLLRGAAPSHPDLFRLVRQTPAASP